MANLKRYIDPGEMDTVVAIQTATTTQDSLGEEEEVWSTVANVWAKVEYSETSAAGTEGVDAGQVVQMQLVTFTLRFLDWITPKMRVVIGSQVFAIHGIAEVGGRRRFQKVVTKLVDSNPI